MRSHRLLVALAAFAVLGLLSWFTLDAVIDVGSSKVELRVVTLIVLAMFFVRTLVHWQRQQRESNSDSGSSVER